MLDVPDRVKEDAVRSIKIDWSKVLQSDENFEDSNDNTGGQ